MTFLQMDLNIFNQMFFMFIPNYLGYVELSEKYVPIEAISFFYLLISTWVYSTFSIPTLEALWISS